MYPSAKDKKKTDEMSELKICKETDQIQTVCYFVANFAFYNSEYLKVTSIFATAVISMGSLQQESGSTD